MYDELHTVSTERRVIAVGLVIRPTNKQRTGTRAAAVRGYVRRCARTPSVRTGTDTQANALPREMRGMTDTTAEKATQDRWSTHRTTG